MAVISVVVLIRGWVGGVDGSNRYPVSKKTPRGTHMPKQVTKLLINMQYKMKLVCVICFTSMLSY